jgi:predicted dehydrogenase
LFIDRRFLYRHIWVGDPAGGVQRAANDLMAGTAGPAKLSHDHDHGWPPMSPLRIGLLGAARITPNAVIAPAAAREDVVLSAVAARDPARARAFADLHGVADTSPTYAELIARDDVDLVYVALPPAAHAEWSIRALQAGKAVLCEKPFTMSDIDAQAMTDAAMRCGRPLIEAFHYRFHQVLRSAFALVREGALGRLIKAEAVFHARIAEGPDEVRWRADQGGGALMDLGCYCVHALRTLAGEEPAVVSAAAGVRRGVDTETKAELRFPTGLVAQLGCSMISEGFRARLVVQGERGALQINNFILPQGGCRFVTVIDGRQEVRPVDGPSTFAAQLDHVVEVVRGGATPLTGGADSVATMAVIDQIKRASGRGG